ncbi:MAG: (2Fe-2S)-binding protein [Chloroflexi bacterium]|jgi:aerobic-type carbon monoxide dehydrogenase small subunit (CoxS/CutS family)|nr:(2Fe-2S)-binding protein [Chloroflexota bacterium]
MASDDDRDILDDEPVTPPATPATNGSTTPPLHPPGPSRRAFLIGAAAGGAAGVVAGAGIVQVVGGGPLGGAVRTGPPPEGKAGEPVASQVIRLTVNGQTHELLVKAHRTLAEVLRQDLALTGTKIGCNRSECSACTVILNGKAVNSCSELAIRANGGTVITIEGLEKNGKLHPVQEAFAQRMGLQCGFCTPGQIMQATALLMRIPNPTDEQILHAMAGNLCKCSAYPHILAAVKDAAKMMKA